MDVQLCPSCISSAVAVESSQGRKASVFNPPPNQYLQGDGLNLFVFEFLDMSPVPKVIGLIKTPLKHAALLNVSLDHSGTITCGAFAPLYYPDSVAEIQMIGYPGRQGIISTIFFLTIF
jgi:hypothetical protein